MRKLTLFALLVCLISLGACSKSDDNNQATNPTNNNQPISNTNNFIINGVKDLSLEVGKTETLPLAIEYVEGEQEIVTLSIEGLPSHVTAEFSNAAGTPSFATMLNITADFEASGTHTIAIKAATATGKIKFLTFQLVIKGASNCVSLLEGRYDNTTMSCGGDKPTPISFSQIIADPNNPKEFKYNSYDAFSSFTLDCIADCANSTLTVKNDTTRSGSTTEVYSGSGTFELPNKFTINYTYTKIEGTTVVRTTNCTITGTK